MCGLVLTEAHSKGCYEQGHKGTQTKTPTDQNSDKISLKLVYTACNMNHDRTVQMEELGFPQSR